VRPRRSRPKDIGGAKFFKPEFVTNDGLVLGVKPSCFSSQDCSPTFAN
jgi:hypothetical protein